MPNETEPQTNEVTTETTPTLDQFLQAVRDDDAALAAEMPEPIEMWAPVCSRHPDKPLALFPAEGRAWQWALNEFGAHSNVTVRAFMGAAAAVGP